MGTDHAPTPPPNRAEPDGPIPQYVAPSTGNIFQLNGSMVTQAEARATCNAQGGHLAIFLTMQEQVGGWMLRPRRGLRTTSGILP